MELEDIDEGLAFYLESISKFPLLSHEQEPRASRETLITSNLKLAVHIAKSYARNVDELIERVQDANVGLCQAADAFDSSKGKFSVCAGYYIRAAIRNRRVDSFGKPLRRRSGCTITLTNWDELVYEVGDSPFENVDQCLSLTMAGRRLTQKQREVLTARLRGDSLQEIADRKRVSHQAVRDLERNAIKRMKACEC